MDNIDRIATLTEQPTGYLTERLNQLAHSLGRIPHGEERRTQLLRELNHVTFELRVRTDEAQTQELGSLAVAGRL